jgi:hypothetical protein
VSWDVVVAVDIGTWNLLEDWMEGPTAKTGSGMGWDNPLAGDGFRTLGSPISHRGDRGAVCHHEQGSSDDNPG